MGRRAGAFLAVALLVAVACTSGGAEARDDGASALAVLDARTGEERWHAPSSDRDDTFSGVGLGAGIAIGSHGGSDRPSRTEAYDISSGELEWARKYVGWIVPKAGDHVSRALDVAARGIVVAYGDFPAPRVVGLDAETGKERWRLPEPERFIELSDTLVFTGRTDAEPKNTLTAFDRRSGERRWSFPMMPTLPTSFTVVAANRSTVVVALGPYSSFIGLTTFFVLDARTGQERYPSFQVADPPIEWSDFSIVDGALVYAEGGDALARDLRTGEVRWRHATDAVPSPGVVNEPGMTVRISTDQRTVFTRREQGFDVLDARSGELRWTSSRNESVWGSDGDIVIVRRGRWGIAALDVDTGKQRWRRDATDVLTEGFQTELGITVRSGTVALSMQPPSN